MKVSVITVCYNDRSGLEKTIKSVLSQRGVELDYIIMDGGSTDGSKDLVDQYRSLVAHAISEKDQGVFDAMNKGLNRAIGEYVIFMNSGDYFLQEDSLAKLTRGAEHYPDFIYGDIYFEYKEGRRKHIKFPERLRLSGLFNHFLPHQATLTKRQLLVDRGGYDLRYKFIADSAFIWNAIVNDHSSYQHVDEIISVCEFGGLSTDVNRNGDAMQQERLRFYQEKFPMVYEDYLELYELRKFKKAHFVNERPTLLERIKNKLK